MAEEARRKVEAEMAALKAAEEEARHKVAIEAEAKRLADEALARAQAERAAADAAARQKADAEAKQKAEADAKTGGEAAARKNAEAAETALRLSTVDRQRLQVALTALGFDTGGSDGSFGPRTRQMVAKWQKSRRDPDTGFLTAMQQQALLRDAQPAVAKFDDDQRKQEEEAKKKAEEDARPKAAAAVPASPTVPAPGAPATAAPGGRNPFDGRWTGNATFANGRVEALTLDVHNGAGRNGWRVGRCKSSSNYALTVTPDGRWSVYFEGFDEECKKQVNTFTGTLQGNALSFRFNNGQNSFTLGR